MPLYAFDGTWLSPTDKSNVFLLWKAYVELYSEGEATYYSGVGTDRGFIRKRLDGATGLGTAGRADKAYEDLIRRVQKCGQPKTPLVIVGFSRGATSAMYLINRIVSEEGEEDLSPIELSVAFVGLFDMVRSVGIPLHVGRRLFGRSTRRPERNESFEARLRILLSGTQTRHAIALDERRRLFDRRDPLAHVRKELDIALEQIDESTQQEREIAEARTQSGKGISPIDLLMGLRDRFLDRSGRLQKKLKELEAMEKAWGTKQVHFRGVHSDIGGKRTSNSTKSGLSDIALLWMLEGIGFALDDKEEAVSMLEAIEADVSVDEAIEACVDGNHKAPIGGNLNPWLGRPRDLLPGTGPRSKPILHRTVVMRNDTAEAYRMRQSLTRFLRPFRWWNHPPRTIPKPCKYEVEECGWAFK